MKNILVLTGSPRKNGNSDLLADAFISGAKEAGHELHLFAAGRKKIRGCMACQTCFSKGAACSFKDDFNEVAPFIEKADMIVFASPLYFYSFSTQIKSTIDKMYSFFIGKRPLKIKECMLLGCGETNEIKDFDGMVRSYELIADFMKWEDKGQIIVPNVNHKGDILQTDGLAKAKILGLSI